jgi:aspartate racemase
MDNVNEMVVGVLGGMGSYSTLHFFERLLDAFEVEKEWERPRVIIDNNCVLPSRVRAILYDERREELTRGMADSLDRLLGYEPDVIAIPCNTAHVFLEEVRRHRGGREDRVLHMLDATASACVARGHRDVFLLATEGTIATRVYEDSCDPQGVRVHNPTDAQLVQVRAFIEQVKRKDALDHEGFASFLAGLGHDAVVLGCTELSLFYNESLPVTLIDPVQVVIDAIAELSRNR